MFATRRVSSFQKRSGEEMQSITMPLENRQLPVHQQHKVVRRNSNAGKTILTQNVSHVSVRTQSLSLASTKAVTALTPYVKNIGQQMQSATTNESLQEKLCIAFQNAKSNVVNSNARPIKPHLLNAIEEIKLNQSLKFMPDQLLKEITRRCIKNAGSNPITSGGSKKLSVDVQDEAAVDRLLAKHQQIMSEVKDRIHHDVELAMKQIGLQTLAEKQTVAKVVSKVDDDDDDFFVEEAPPLPTIIRHK